MTELPIGAVVERHKEQQPIFPKGALGLVLGRAPDVYSLAVQEPVYAVWYKPMKQVIYSRGSSWVESKSNPWNCL